MMNWRAPKHTDGFLFFSEEIDFCQKQHATTELFVLDFESFPEESCGRLAPSDTTARSMERKKIKREVLFKQSLCVVNRIKGDGESH